MSLNLEGGPNDDQVRHRELRGAMHEAYTANPTAGDCALFMERVGEISSELEASGKLVFSESQEQDRADVTREFLKTRENHPTRRRKTNMARFLGSLHAAQEDLPFWSTKLWERGYFAVENDMLCGKAFERIVMDIGPAATVSEGGRRVSTTTNITMDVKVLRAACGTAVAISVVLLGNCGSRRKVKMVCKVLGVLKDWHTAQNLALRSCSGALEFIRGQVANGDFWKMIMSIMALLEDSSALEYCEFFNDICEEGLEEGDDFAEVYGMLVFAQRFAREKRLLWLM